MNHIQNVTLIFVYLYTSYYIFIYFRGGFFDFKMNHI